MAVYKLCLEGVCRPPMSWEGQGSNTRTRLERIGGEVKTLEGMKKTCRTGFVKVCLAWPTPKLRSLW